MAECHHLRNTTYPVGNYFFKIIEKAETAVKCDRNEIKNYKCRVTVSRSLTF